MRALVALALIWCAVGAIAQRYVPGHFTKTGRYAAGHWTKARRHSSGTTHRRKSSSTAEADMIGQDRHKESRHYPGHVDSKGKYVPGGDRSVWVRDGEAPATHRQRRSGEQVTADMVSAGKHQEERFYPGHYAKDGHWVAPRSRRAWVDKTDAGSRQPVTPMTSDPASSSRSSSVGPSAGDNDFPHESPVKSRKSAEEVEAEMKAQGRHREHRYYPDHYAKDGHLIKAHWQWVWVKD